jgi:D-tyrosyl-tRNA(Tyr) deacylase
VSEASVSVDGTVIGRIGAGLCVLVGVTHTDTVAAADRMAERLFHLRVFSDGEGRINRSAAVEGAEIMVVSQFSLYADTSRGRRPSFVAAARPEQAEPLVECLVEALRGLGAVVATGRFRADMAVALVNDGPLTVTVET